MNEDLLNLLALKSVHTSEHLKKALELSYQHVHYSGQGQMRYYNGFVMKLWKQVHIRLTGSTLRLGHENSISSQGDSSHLDKTGSHTVMDCVNDSTGQAKSRTIMLDSIANVEISLNLPLFPRVQQALGARRSSASAETCPHDQSTKAYFIFHKVIYFLFCCFFIYSRSHRSA